MSDDGNSHGRDPLAAVDELVRLLRGDDLDFDRIEASAAVVLETGDGALRPALARHLDGFLDDGDWYARDEIARILYELCGAKAMPALLRAMARDLGDDQDGLSSWAVDLFHTDHADRAGSGPRLRPV